MTLPSSLRKINCSDNKLSNIYFLEHCHLLEELTIANNLLYDLKLTFKSSKNNLKSLNGEFRYKNLMFFDCSCNKIQFIEGLINAINLTVLKMSQNQLTFTRNVIN